MYACISETGRGFFEVVRAHENGSATFRNPPYRFVMFESLGAASRDNSYRGEFEQEGALAPVPHIRAVNSRLLLSSEPPGGHQTASMPRSGVCTRPALALAYRSSPGSQDMVTEGAHLSAN